MEGGDAGQKWRDKYGPALPSKLPSFINDWRGDGKAWMEENNGTGRHDVDNKLARADEKTQLCVKLEQQYRAFCDNLQDEGRSGAALGGAKAGQAAMKAAERRALAQKAGEQRGPDAERAADKGGKIQIGSGGMHRRKGNKKGDADLSSFSDTSDIDSDAARKKQHEQDFPGGADGDVPSDAEPQGSQDIYVFSSTSSNSPVIVKGKVSDPVSPIIGRGRKGKDKPGGQKKPSLKRKAARDANKPRPGHAKSPKRSSVSGANSSVLCLHDSLGAIVKGSNEVQQHLIQAGAQQVLL